jgi:PD-(D/E)XK nuclease superfamily protein
MWPRIAYRYLLRKEDTVRHSFGLCPSFMSKKNDNTAKKQRPDSSPLALDRLRRSPARPSELIEIQAVALTTTKQRGEAAEAAFLAKAAALGFAVAKPWGDSRRYDFVVDSGYGLWRVQVKSTNLCCRSQYFVKAQGRQKVYTKEEIDFLVAYLIPENLWYVVPVEAFAPRKILHFHPYSPRKSLYERHREAWCLLDCPRKARGQNDMPARCRSEQIDVRCAVCPLGRKSVP